MRILAIDLGTSSVKLMRMDERGAVLSVDRVPMSRLDIPGWLDAIRENIAAHDDGPTITAITVTGQMHGLMTLERDGIRGEGIPWHDQRSAPVLPEVRDTIGDNAAVVTGGPIAAGFQAASLAWLRRHEPDRWSRIERVLLPKDALVHAFTGQAVTDPTDAVGTGMFAPATGDWAWDVVDALAIPHHWLPEIISSGSIAGDVMPGIAGKLGIPVGTPVFIAGGDAPVGAYGAGVTANDDALVMLSSGAQVILPARTWAPDPDGRWYTWPSASPEGTAPYLRVGTLLNGGNVLEWANNALPDVPLLDLPTSLIALPHLLGMREHPGASGAVLGITPDTTPGELRRALVEGVAFSIRRKLDAMANDGPQPTRVQLGGGLAHVPENRQLFTDVLGIPCEPVGQIDLSAYGAGMIALATLTGYRQSTAPRVDNATAPSPDHAWYYEQMYALYREIDDAMTPAMQRLAWLVNNHQ